MLRIGGTSTEASLLCVQNGLIRLAVYERMALFCGANFTIHILLLGTGIDMVSIPLVDPNCPSTPFSPFPLHLSRSISFFLASLPLSFTHTPTPFVDSSRRVLNSKRAESVNGNRLTDVLTKLLAADFQRKTRLDPFENKRSKAKMWNAAEVSKNVLSTLNSAKVGVACCRTVVNHYI